LHVAILGIHTRRDGLSITIDNLHVKLLFSKIVKGKDHYLLGDVRPCRQSRRNVGDIVWMYIWKNNT
jgi:hypothetical protein